MTTDAGPARVAHPRLTLATSVLASSLAFIDGSVVNVGLPAIGRGLHTGAAGLQWVVDAYLLPLSALLLMGGSLGDLFGRRRLLLIGVALFAVASAACGLAPAAPWLWAARAAQGAGAALLLPNSLALLNGAFEGEARGRAIGTWAAAGAASAAAGPLLGGWLVDGAGWRWIFLVSVPVALGALVLAWRFVEDAREDGRPAPDWAGALLATAGLGALTSGLILATGTGGSRGAALALVGAGLALLLGFAGWERRLGDRAMAPPDLFGSRAFIGLTALTLLLYGALGGLLVLLPYRLMDSAGYSATAAGAALLPFPAVVALASPHVGRLATRIGPRPLLSVGPVVTAAGFLLTLRIGGPGGYVLTVLPAILTISAGMACAAAPLTTAVLASVDGRHTGVASGFNSAVARTGGLIATALLGGVLSAHGAALGPAFRTAATAGAACAALAGAAAFLLLDPGLGVAAQKKEG